MSTARHYYITTLPAIGELGTSPEMGLADLVEHVADNSSWHQQVEALILLDDLLQRESFLAGEAGDVEPAVLTVQQARGEAPLPEFLVPEVASDQTLVIEADELWEHYFRYAHQLGRSAGSRFLVRWVEFEVTLRNTLATARARRLGLDELGYMVAPDLADDQEDMSRFLTEWESAATPLAGLRTVVRARWSWIEEHDAWFTFSVDELLAYVARTMLLEQWRRTARKDEVAS